MCSISSFRINGYIAGFSPQRVPSLMYVLQTGALALAVLMILASTPSFSQTSAPAVTSEHGVRAEEAPTGSMIRRYAIRDTPLPVNKRYHEFSAEEKAKLHGYYENIVPGDEPPFPENGLNPVLNAIIKAQEKLRVRGDLFLIASVGSDGLVSEVKAIGSPSPEMTQFAAATLVVTKFKPAICAGKPCAMQYPLRYRFELN